MTEDSVRRSIVRWELFGFLFILFIARGTLDFWAAKAAGLLVMCAMMAVLFNAQLLSWAAASFGLTCSISPWRPRKGSTPDIASWRVERLG
jgi:hypothetical protein